VTDVEKAEYEDVLRKLVAKCEALAAENAALKAGLDAHSTLKSIYADANQPATVRVRAAQAALGHETPPLKSVEPPMDLVAEPTEPLAVTVERGRARMNRLLSLSLEERARMIPGSSGDGGDDSND
jgi:hypothetical protein